MITHSPKQTYLLPSLGTLLLALLLASQPVASAVEYAQLDILTRYLGNPTWRSILYIAISALVMLALWIRLYFTRLNPAWNHRSLLAVFINHMAPMVFVASILISWDYAEAKSISTISMIGVPALVLGVPLLLLIIERTVAMALYRVGLFAWDHEMFHLAIRCLGSDLRLRPGEPHLLRLCGLLFVIENEPEKAISMIERLKPEDYRKDEELLQALEQAYRVQGNQPRALECLELLRVLRPGSQAGLTRRIMDDYLALGRDREALGLIESGEMKLDLNLLILRQHLLVKLGEVAQAIDQLQRMAAREGPPHRQAIKLYQDLLELMPNSGEIRVNLGLLMIENPIEPVREEGAKLLEKALLEDPHRLYLARHLANYYMERKQPDKARDHFRRLTSEGDADPESYLTFAQMLSDSEEYDEAADVLRNMIDLLPEEWRGHYRLARVLLASHKIDEAESELAIAEELAPEEGRGSVEYVRGEIENIRRHQALTRMTKEMSEADEISGEQRLNLIDEMLGMEEWIDKALDACDQLREQHPELTPQIETLIQRGIERSKRNFRLRDYLGDLLYQQQRFDDLLELYRKMAEQSLDPPKVMIEGCRKIISRVPSHIEARLEMAIAQRARQDWQGVLDALDPLLTSKGSLLEPEDKALWIEAAWHAGRIDDAINVGLPLYEHFRHEVGFILMLLEILQEGGRYKDANEILQQAIEANPDEDRLKKVMRQITKKWQEYRLGELEEMARTRPLTPEQHMEKAELHRERSEFEKAITHYQRAAEQDDLAKIAMIRMAGSLIERGLFDLAQEVLEPIELSRELADAEPGVKELFYQLARQMERNKRPHVAVRFYKKLFLIDASYEDVVHRLERLSS
ncbi:tetratricopeptide repeat protein [bacterium]|nr:tetratricopeptide repeat protein [bacterium]